MWKSACSDVYNLLMTSIPVLSVNWWIKLIELHKLEYIYLFKTSSARDPSLYSVIWLSNAFDLSWIDFRWIIYQTTNFVLRAISIIRSVYTM